MDYLCTFGTTKGHRSASQVRHHSSIKTGATLGHFGGTIMPIRGESPSYGQHRQHHSRFTSFFSARIKLRLRELLLAYSCFNQPAEVDRDLDATDIFKDVSTLHFFEGASVFANSLDYRVRIMLSLPGLFLPSSRLYVFKDHRLEDADRRFLELESGLPCRTPRS